MKNNKTLLHIGCNAGSESMPKYFREQCDYTELLLNGYLADNLNSLIDLDKTPDIIFIQIQSDTIAGRNSNTFIGDQIRYFKNNGSFVINWTGDMRGNTPRWMTQFAHNVSATMFSNLKDVEFFKSAGMPTGFLQQGIDTNIFTPEGDKADVPDIVFLANNYANQFPLSRYRRNAVNRLRAHYGNRFKVFGNGWGSDSGNVNSSQYEESKVYRGCKIAISISHFDADRYFSDRLGRAMCSGAMVLSHNYQGLERDFEVENHLDIFGNLDEMVSSIDYYLANDDKRKEIAKSGQEHASKEFSYQNVVKQIIELGS